MQRASPDRGRRRSDTPSDSAEDRDEDYDEEEDEDRRTQSTARTADEEDDISEMSVGVPGSAGTGSGSERNTVRGGARMISFWQPIAFR